MHLYIIDLYVLGDDALLVRGLSCKPNIYMSWSTSELRVRLAMDHGLCKYDGEQLYFTYYKPKLISLSF